MGFENKFYSQHKSLSFNDVLIQPSEVSLIESRLDTVLRSKLSRNIKLSIPILASPMDKVVDLEVAQVMALYGASACFHRFQSIEDQLEQVKEFKKWAHLINRPIYTIAAVSSHLEGPEAERIDRLQEYTDVFVIDTAMGTNIKVLKSIEFIKKKYPDKEIIAGNIVTAEGAMTLINAGVDGIRAGIGNGSACLTRLQTGVGRGQVTVLIECSDLCKKYGVSLICDGGISSPGDFAKAIAAGADCVIMGSPLAGHIESPGEVYYRYSDHFFKGDYPIYLPKVGPRLAKEIEGLDKYKQYRGMASKELQTDWRGGLKEGTTYEGMQKYIKLKGPLKETLDNFAGGLRSAMSYCNSKTIEEFHNKAKFEKLSTGSQRESYERPSIT